MPKHSRKKAAALKRHHTKHGEVDPTETRELQQDSSFVPENSDPSSQPDAGSTASSTASSILRRAGTSVQAFFAGKSRVTASPAPPLIPDLAPDLHPDREIEEAVKPLSKKHRISDADSDIEIIKMASSLFSVPAPDSPSIDMDMGPSPFSEPVGSPVLHSEPSGSLHPSVLIPETTSHVPARQTESLPIPTTEGSSEMPTALAPPADGLGNITDISASADDLKNPKETHTHLAKLIERISGSCESRGRCSQTQLLRTKYSISKL
ncbi:hypothetical protein B0H10DRAFT_1951422 [Mycena sp. CBHHK59/15]|nr:hypothetical protein B0H10DRAFT_1951422 [Mycena sp. CBHHK59/15]